MEYAIVCLGNPGAEYELTRHNLGYWTADILCRKLKCGLKQGKGDYLIGRKKLRDESLYVVKPTTYMNLSGRAVSQLVNKYELTSNQVLVVCDDFALEQGRIRIRDKGSDGGHNGLYSIIAELGTTEFPRIRLGIGPVPPEVDPADFVLAKIEESAINTLRELADRASEAVIDYVTRGLGFAAGKYNVKPSAPDELMDGADRPREV
jgi:PTH1 family peptidyl-tRNA hydrolase